MHFDPSLCIFFFTRSSHLTRATNPHQQLQPQCFPSLPQLFFVPRETQSNSLQLFSPPSCSLNLLSSTRSSKPSFLLCPSPLPCSPNQPVSSFAPFSCRPTTKCSRMHLWVGVDRNSLPPVPRSCHQRAVGHACAANEKPHLS
jgi:hypothetical protein